ncbi:Disabled 2-interacting protein [Dermatophagoides farinae]|uniref:Serine/threonine-protein phosphatase 1 regulatory subunit 10 n=1 Tax=Dermatophagoides farinae TaxID=6954 RepID=A0A922L0M7_DERFA|nr:Disabled 2-interacting protein [Dermatophagoides farinae]
MVLSENRDLLLINCWMPEIFKMAPINPVQILDAFTPLLTENGGIKPVEDQTQFQKIYDIMKNCSTKLVSKCIYYQILMSTSPEVLEQFLKIGGWDLICLWVKSSRDIGNVTFLLDLLKLLHILPMNIDRLRENECPKIVKKLCKHENEQIALKAKQIIKKWTKIIQTLSTTTTTSTSSSDKINSNSSKEKKRKSLDNSSSSSSSSSSSDSHSIKKSKLSNSTDTETKAVNKLDRSSNEAIADVYETYTADEMNKLLLEKPSAPSETTTITVKRPVTAKVKPGKFRLDLSTPPSTKNEKTKKLKDNQKMIKKSLSNDKSFKVTSPTPATRTVLKDSMSFMDALSMMPVTNVVKKRRKTTPTTTTSALALNTNIISSDNMKQDSFTLNDKSNSSNNNSSEMTINDMSSSTNSQDTESNNKLNNGAGSTLTITNDADLGSSDNTNNSNNDNVNDGSHTTTATSKSVAPKFSFYKDILDEKCDGSNDNVENDASMKLNINNNNNISDDASDSKNKDSTASYGITNNVTIKNNVVNIHTEDEKSIIHRQNDDDGDDHDKKLDSKSKATNDSFSVNSSKPKPILCYIRKNSKKRVRWPDDDTDLEKVRYFELDETERINVTRPSADMKRFDMKHEAQMMINVLPMLPWHLIPIDIDSSNILVERGKDSRERIIQMERMKTTLECFYFHNQLPDSADEPEHNAYELMSDLSSQDMKMKIIPLEDENSVTMDRAFIQDYSTTMGQQQQQPPQIIDPIINYNNNNNNNNMPFNVGGGPTDNGENYPLGSGEQNYLPPPSLPSQTLGYSHQQPIGPQQSNYNAGYQSNLPPNNYNDNNVGPPPPTHQPFDQPQQSLNNNFNSDYNNSYHQPPVFNPTPSSPYSDFSNVPPQPNSQNFGPGPPQFHNQSFGPPPLSQPIQSNDNYWPEPNFGNNTNPNNNHNPNYPPGGPPPPGPPPPPPYHQGPPGGGPRMFRPRGPGGGPRGPRFFGGHRGGSGGGGDICRFFFKTGKCKFENRCNYSHVMDQQKPPIRF